MQEKPKLLRITTVPVSLHKLLNGQINYMQSNGFDVIVASSEGKEIEMIEKETGLIVNTISLTRKISPFSDLKALWQLYLLIKQHKPDIVHTHTPKAGLIGMLAAAIARVPIRLHTVAGLPLLEANGVKRTVLMTVEKLTYRCATNVYTNSFGLKKIILKNKLIKPSKIKVLANGSSNGIDTVFFNPELYDLQQLKAMRKDLGILSKDFVFIFVGRLVGDKGINELVDAFVKLNYKYKNTKLLLVGNEEPDLDPLLPRTIEAISNNSNIITTGWVEDVRPFFAISDILVFPSYREGLPNVVLQAGAMGLPSIVSNINGNNEIIIHGKNGIIVPVKNTQKLYKSMKELMTNKVLLVNLKKNARSCIIKRYDQSKVWKEILNEYNRLLNS